MKSFLLHGQESERLLYRRVVPADFDSWLPFYHDPQSTRYWEGLPDDPLLACKDQFNRIFERYENGLGGMNALILKENMAFVGLCGLLVQEVDGFKELEIGYSILPEYRRKGLALEAAGKCKDHAFEHKLAPSLISIIHINNIPSQKVASKNGMSPDKKTTYKGNPVYIYRITA